MGKAPVPADQPIRQYLGRSLRRVGVLFAALALAPLAWIGIQARPTLEDPLWDALMALGFVAAGGLCLLPITTTRWTAKLWRPPSVANDIFDLHERLAYVLLAIVIAHAVGLLIHEPTLVEYLKPSAPSYMWSGLAAGLLLIVQVVGSVRARRLRTQYLRWRREHALLSLTVLVLMIHHIVASGYYLGGALATIALVALLAAPTALYRLPVRLRSSSKSSARPRQASDVTTVAAIIGLIWLAIAAGFAWIRL